MNHAVEEQVRALAQPLWESAARPYGMAMDFWLMAEQMVLEMMSATARMQSAMLAETPPPRVDVPEAAPVAQIRALAECIWESAGRRYEMTQECWLAAERHVLAMVRATNVGSTRDWVDDMSALPPSAYLERIRASAYYMWEAAGRNYGQALEFWLAAERQTLAMMSAARMPATSEDAAAAAPQPSNTHEPAAAPEPAAATDPDPTAITETAAATEPAAAAVQDVATPAPAPAPEVAAETVAAAEPAAAKPRKRIKTAKAKILPEPNAAAESNQGDAGKR